MQEQQLIAMLRNLAHPEFAENFDDDTAFVSPLPAYKRLLVTSDTIVEGVHYDSQADYADVATKLLAVNLSDLAAKGAKPLYYTLNLTVTQNKTEAWWQGFCDTLLNIQELFSFSLLGGDIAVNPGPSLILSATMLGEADELHIIKRAGARLSDDVYVSGTIGDAFLGLLLVQKPHLFTQLRPPLKNFLSTRYYRPSARILLGQLLHLFANSATDISDSLITSLGLISHSSKCSMSVDASLIPLSRAARLSLKLGVCSLNDLLTNGDDYELLFTSLPHKEQAIQKIAKQLKLPLTKIGCVSNDDAPLTIHNLNQKNDVLHIHDPTSSGYIHVF